MAYPITATTVKESGNGSKTAFSFAFTVLATTELNVYKGTIATDEPGDKLLLGVDYTVVLNTAGGGVVTFAVAPTNAQFSLIESAVPNDSTIVMVPRGRFQDQAILNAFTRVSIQQQQQAEKIERCVKVPIGSSTSANDLISGLQDDISEANGSANKAAAEAAAEAAQAAAEASAAAAASSASDAQTAKNAAEAAQAAAEAAASIMPDPIGNGLELLRANAGGTANEYSGVAISTDGTFASNSDAKIPTEKASKTYVDSVKGETYVESIRTLSIPWSANNLVDVDMSAYVPSGTKRVLLYVQLKDTVVGAALVFRKNGGSQNYGVIQAQTANNEIYDQIIVPLDSNRVFEAYTNAGSVTVRQVILLGYWI